MNKRTLACAFVLCAATLHAQVAQASFMSSLGITSNFYDPAGWTVGDSLTTHQIWDAKTSSTGNLPDEAYDSAGVSLTMPTHSVKSPGLLTGTQNFYAFSGDFGGTADIYNHGTAGANLGTHVIVQIGSSVNPSEDSFPGHGTGTFLDSVQLLDLSDNLLTGGANGDALQIAEVAFQSGVSTSFGPTDYQELIFEFWLPNFTGDFRLDWDQKVHATIDTLRVDTKIAEAVGGGTPFALTGAAEVPEPSSLAIVGLVSLLGVALRRRVTQFA